MQIPIKPKSKTFPISIIVVSVVLLTVFVSLLFIRSWKYKNALAHLNVTDLDSVINVMKYAGDDKNVVLSIAQKYSDNHLYSDSARLLLYFLQYLDPNSDEALKLLQDCYVELGADEKFISSFLNPTFSLEDFKVTSRYGGEGYGFADGIYCEFLGGYAKAKISSICPLSVCACENGVYALDSTDRLLKLISREGSSFDLVFDFKINEFLYHDGTVYYIDNAGMPHGKNSTLLNDGELAMNIKLENEDVICTVFDCNYNPIREIKLN